MSPLIDSLQKRYTDVRNEATDTNKPIKERASFLFNYVLNEGGPLIQVSDVVLESSARSSLALTALALCREGDASGFGIPGEQEQSSSKRFGQWHPRRGKWQHILLVAA
jgi:hypothetical protein